MIVGQDATAVALRDAFPVVEVHTLVVPWQHVPSVFDFTETDQAQIRRLVLQVRSALADQLPPAGQTVQYAHIHIVP